MSAEELMLLNCGVGGLLTVSWMQGDETIKSLRKSILNIHFRGWGWSSNTLSTWCEEPTHWKRPWCWERLRAEGEGDNRGRDGWMPSPTQWVRIWVYSGSWWRTGRPGVLRFMVSQKIGHDWATKLNRTNLSLGLRKSEWEKDDIWGRFFYGNMRERFSYILCLYFNFFSYSHTHF